MSAQDRADETLSRISGDLDNIRLGICPFEGDESIITVNGAPVGMTVSASCRPEFHRWWPGLKHHISLMLERRFGEMWAKQEDESRMRELHITEDGRVQGKPTSLVHLFALGDLTNESLSTLAHACEAELQDRGRRQDGDGI